MPTDRVIDFAEMSGPVGPDSLRLPGAPQHLQNAVQGLQALGQDLDRVSADLKAANPPGPNPGRTVGAVSRLAQRTGAALDDDVQRLKALEQSVDQVRELIHGGQQDALPELRQRWQQARQQLIEAVQAENAENAQREQEQERQQREREQEREREDRDGPGGRGGRGERGDRGGRDDDRPRVHAEVVEFEPHRPHQEPINGMALARHIDDNQVEEYDGLFRRLFGTVFREPGGDVAGAFNRGGHIESAIQEYRRTVRSVLEEYAQLVQRIESADEELAQKLPRQERAQLVATQVDLSPAPDAQPAEPSVSNPATIRKLAQELHTQAQALNKADGQLEDIRLAMRQGRMLGQGERIGSNDGFKTDWMQHLQDLRQRLNGSHEKAIEVAHKMEQLDESGAAEVRQAGRADKD